MYDPPCQNYLIQLCDAIHYYESKACLNITRPNERGGDVMDNNRGEKAYTPEVNDKYIYAYVEQAVIAKKLGFDMCSVHFAYRSLIAVPGALDEVDALQNVRFVMKRGAVIKDEITN